jgi:hypothetical protein
MAAGYLYSVGDKALYDALSQKKFTPITLRELYLERGVLISTKTPKKELAKNLSKDTHDYHDHQRISKKIGSVKRRERNSAVYFNSALKLENSSVLSDTVSSSLMKFENYLNSVGECGNVTIRESSILFRVNYEDTDYNKNEFKQVVKKEAVLTFDFLQDGGCSLRHPKNEKMSGYVDDILALINSSLHDNNLITERVELLIVEDSNIRGRFFKDLVKRIGDQVLLDVTDVYLYHPAPSDEDLHTLDWHITKSSLKGNGVLNSTELSTFEDKGFYISKIIWKSTSKEFDSDIYEFEAQFDDPHNFTGFSYLPRGFYKYQATGLYNKTRT